MHRHRQQPGLEGRGHIFWLAASGGLGLVSAALWITLLLFVAGGVSRFASDGSLGLAEALLAVGAAVSAAGLVGLHRIDRRLARLTGVSAELARGKLELRADERGGDSLAGLAVAVNRLGDRSRDAWSELNSREEEIRRLVNYDPLTQLPNRSLFQELLVKELARARRASQLVGVVLIDIDNFKSVNETLGYAFGDRLLLMCAGHVLSVLREADTVARSGDNEFAMVVAGAQQIEHVMKAATRLHRSFDVPIVVEDRELLLSTSLGVALFPQHSEEPAELVKCAERALRRAKAGGGKRISVYQATMRSGDRDRLDLEQELRRAIPNGQLVVFFQPQVRLTDGALVGMEALVRWQHPERGLISAGEFIPIAEDSGLMPEIGQWILEQICHQCRAWQDSGLSPVPISVNVSARQFDSADMSESVRDALAADGLDARLLQIEVTESLALNHIEHVPRCLAKLRELGVRIHLDDFGKGYSSLSYLLKYPVDVLKIDRSFVADVAESHHSAAIVRATIALARSLDLEVIAEGVETEEQLQFLLDHECASGQGFLLGRPMPSTELEPALRSGSIALPTGLVQAAG